MTETLWNTSSEVLSASLDLFKKKLEDIKRGHDNYNNFSPNDVVMVSQIVDKAVMIQVHLNQTEQ